MSTIVFGAGGSRIGGIFSQTLVSTADIDLTGIDIVNDTTPQLGGDLDAQSNSVDNINELKFKPSAGGRKTVLNMPFPGQHFVKIQAFGSSAGQNKFNGIVSSYDFSGTETYVGLMDWQYGTGGKKARFGFLSDDGFTGDAAIEINQPTLEVRIKDTYKLKSAGAVEFDDITVDKITSAVDASATPNTLIMNANHPNTTDTLHNHMQMVQDYGANAVPDTATGLLTFAVKDDTMSTSELVGRLGGEYDTGGNHVFRIDAMDGSGNPTSYSFAHEGAAMGAVVRMASYTTTERNALTPGNGDVIYNTSNNRFEFYQNGSWVYYTATSA